MLLIVGAFLVTCISINWMSLKRLWENAFLPRVHGTLHLNLRSWVGKGAEGGGSPCYIHQGRPVGDYNLSCPQPLAGSLLVEDDVSAHSLLSAPECWRYIVSL